MALEKKAEITVDDRHRQREDALKAYCQEAITKVLLHSGAAPSEATASLSRELAGTQLLLDK